MICPILINKIKKCYILIMFIHSLKSNAYIFLRYFLIILSYFYFYFSFSLHHIIYSILIFFIFLFSFSPSISYTLKIKISGHFPWSISRHVMSAIEIKTISCYYQNLNNFLLHKHVKKNKKFMLHKLY